MWKLLIVILIQWEMERWEMTCLEAEAELCIAICELIYVNAVACASVMVGFSGVPYLFSSSTVTF